MLKDFKAYQAAISFYKECAQISGTSYLTDQLHRASASIALNLAEGSERGTMADRRRFYRTAMGSIRECQAILDLQSDSLKTKRARKLADELAALTFRLCQSLNQMEKTEPRNTCNGGSDSNSL